MARVKKKAKVFFKSIAQTIDSNKGVGAMLFVFIAVVSSFAVFMAYHAGGYEWDDLFGEYGEFCEMLTGLAVVVVVYLNRYFFFPAHGREKTRSPRALKLFFLICLAFIVIALTVIYPNKEGYDFAAYNWYGLYLLGIVGVMLPCACEIFWSLFKHHNKLIKKASRKRAAGVKAENLFPECLITRIEIDSDCKRLMYSLITVIAFLFVSWRTYFGYARALHFLLVAALVVICMYPFLRIVLIIRTIRNKEINSLEERIIKLDMEILEREKKNKPVGDLEKQRNNLNRSKKRLEERGKFARLGSQISVIGLLSVIVDQLIVWAKAYETIEKFIGSAVDKLRI